MAAPDKPQTGEGRLVCVTGAGGYIGTHIVRELLERGYRVRATVRDAHDDKKTGHLGSLVDDPTRLEIVSADLLKPRSYDSAIAGCERVVHAAAAVRIAAKNPQREIVEPTVRGTRNVLESVRRAGSVARVVMTSSVAAIEDWSMPVGHAYTEADWNNHANIKTAPYALAKTLAERAAWEFQSALPEPERFELTVINPVFVYGPIYAPVHARSSPAIVKTLLRGQYPGCPRLHFPMVDVRDVAVAHVEALERPAASGRRYLLHHQGRWMQEIARILKTHFPDYSISTWRMPDPIVYAAILIDRRLTFGYLRHSLGRAIEIDNRRATEELGLEYTPIEQTLADTGRSLIDFGLVSKPKRKRMGIW